MPRNTVLILNDPLPAPTHCTETQPADPYTHTFDFVPLSMAKHPSSRPFPLDLDHPPTHQHLPPPPQLLFHPPTLDFPPTTTLTPTNMCLRDWTLYTTCSHEVRGKLHLCLSILGLPAHRGGEGKRTTKQEGFCPSCKARFRAARDKILRDPYVIVYERR